MGALIFVKYKIPKKQLIGIIMPQVFFIVWNFTSPTRKYNFPVKIVGQILPLSFSGFFKNDISKAIFKAKVSITL